MLLSKASLHCSQTNSRAASAALVVSGAYKVPYLSLRWGQLCLAGRAEMAEKKNPEGLRPSGL